MTADNGRDKSYCYHSINKTSKADSGLDTAVHFEVQYGRLPYLLQKKQSQMGLIETKPSILTPSPLQE